METIRDYMAESLLSIDADATVLEASQEMHDNKIRSLLVTKDGDYIGIITNHDIGRKYVGDPFDPKTTRVSKIMHFPVFKMDCNKSMEEASETMREHGVHHLMITENDQALGILSITDYAQFLIQHPKNKP